MRWAFNGTYIGPIKTLGEVSGRRKENEEHG
jgi:hypothetical protein